MTARNWHVLGAGAMGCLFAEALARAGNTVTLLLKQPPAQAVQQITVESVGKTRRVSLPAEAASAAEPIEYLLVTTKAYDVCEALSSVRHRLDESSQVLLLSNGMGFEKELKQVLPWLRPFLGTTTEAAFRMAPGYIRHAGQGITRIGCGTLPQPTWFTSWRMAISRSEWVKDIEGALWQKLAINCVVNPLTAVHRCRNGALRENSALSEKVDALCQEIESLARACDKSSVAEQLRENVDQVITATAQNHSSMLQDVLAGRQTEIDYLNGYLVELAAHYQLEMPQNLRVITAIKAM